jgi:transposase InsO family protein
VTVLRSRIPLNISVEHHRVLTLTESPFHGEGYRMVWARLRYQGIQTSKERVRRLMREHGFQAPQRTGHRHGPKAHDGTILTDVPDEMWGTDMTTTVTTEEGQVCVFVAVDHCAAECIGIHASKSGNRFEALEPLRHGVREHFGGFDRDIAMGLAIRHDHGSAYMSDDFQQELAFLGMSSSPVSSGNPRAMASPSDSSAHSEKTCFGSEPLPRSRSWSRPCGSFGVGTTSSG